VRAFGAEQPERTVSRSRRSAAAARRRVAAAGGRARLRTADFF
jgi:hypothetical protein